MKDYPALLHVLGLTGNATSQALEANRDKFSFWIGGEMKALVSCLSVLLLVSGNTPPAQAPQRADSCHFTVSGELAKPTVSGPEDITALVHVVEQPDSPVEILAIDFKDSWLSVVHERMTEQLRCTMKIRRAAFTDILHFPARVVITTVVRRNSV